MLNPNVRDVNNIRDHKLFESAIKEKWTFIGICFVLKLKTLITEIQYKWFKITRKKICSQQNIPKCEATALLVSGLLPKTTLFMFPINFWFAKKIKAPKGWDFF